MTDSKLPPKPPLNPFLCKSENVNPFDISVVWTKLEMSNNQNIAFHTSLSTFPKVWIISEIPGTEYHLIRCEISYQTIAKAALIMSNPIWNVNSPIVKYVGSWSELNQAKGKGNILVAIIILFQFAKCNKTWRGVCFLLHLFLFLCILLILISLISYYRHHRR